MNTEKEDFLVNMTQDENVYLLGLLWADGHVGKQYDISLEINSSDFTYVQPIFEKYGFTKFYERTRYKNNKIFGNPQKAFHISNINLNKHLQSLDYRHKFIVSPYKILNTIPNNKQYLWWRGFFDGDGCFYCNGALHNFTVWGNINQDWDELKKIFHKLDIKKFISKYYERKNGKHCSSCISINSKDDIQKLGTYIYPNRLDIGFERKYKKYLKCISTPVPLYIKKQSLKKGVYFSIWTGKWICRKFSNKKRIVIGSFDDYEKACKAYDDYF